MSRATHSSPASSPATRTPLPDLKAERVQLPAPPSDLELTLTDETAAEALVDWLVGARCETRRATEIAVSGRSVRISAA